MISGLQGHDSARQFAVSRNQGYVAENTYEEVNRMEQQYWNEFLKTGGVCDYLGYKMEVYGHAGGEEDKGGIRKDEPNHSDWNGAVHGTDSRV